MSNEGIQITGFKALTAKIRRLDDKVKKSELNKIFGQVANATLKAAQSEAPRGSGKINTRGKSYTRKKRQIGKTIIDTNYTPGYGKKTIGKAVMRRTQNAVVIVGPRTRKGKDGMYLRRFIIKGTKNIKANPFMERAYKRTKGGVTRETEIKITRYVQKMIDRL